MIIVVKLRPSFELYSTYSCNIKYASYTYVFFMRPTTPLYACSMRVLYTGRVAWKQLAEGSSSFSRRQHNGGIRFPN